MIPPFFILPQSHVGTDVYVSSRIVFGPSIASHASAPATRREISSIAAPLYMVAETDDDGGSHRIRRWFELAQSEATAAGRLTGE